MLSKIVKIILSEITLNEINDYLYDSIIPTGLLSMKSMLKIFTILLVLSGLSFSVFSQGASIALATAGVSATIVEPGSITTDLGNGTLILAGQVVVTPVRARGKSAGLILPVSTGSYTAAFFSLAGTTGYTITINVPSSPLIFHNGANSMKITSFTSEPSLNAGSDMIAGVYVSATPFMVTVNYN